MDIATEGSKIEGNLPLFTKRLNRVLSKARKEDSTWLLCYVIVPSLDIGLTSTIVLPTLLQGIIEKADKWGNDGKNGRIDPFTEVYDVSSFAT